MGLIVPHTDTASMGNHYGPAERQPDSHAPAAIPFRMPAGIEKIEYMGLVLQGNSRPVIRRRGTGVSTVKRGSRTPSGAKRWRRISPGTPAAIVNQKKARQPARRAAPR